MSDQHFTALMPAITAAIREGELDVAVRLLLEAIRAVEAESAAKGPRWPPAPAYYERLAIVYRKLKQPEMEIAVLERYVAAFRGKAEPPFPHLVERLKKARARVASKSSRG